MSEPLVTLEAPWLIDEGTPLTLRFPDRRRFPEELHIVRLDLYPFFAASHMQRHFGFWDIPLRDLPGEATRLDISGGDLWLHGAAGPMRLAPVFRSPLPLRGYAMVHVSLWDLGQSPPRQLGTVPYHHLLWPGAHELPMEFAMLSVTQRCNLCCPSCMRHTPERWEAVDVAPEVVERFVAAGSTFRAAFLGGIGEPLLHAGFVDIVRALKKVMPGGGHVGLNTNGTLLDERLAASLVDSGVNWLSFSFDGARKETFERLRSGASFEAVTGNIRTTVERRRRSGRTDLRLGANFVVQEANHRELTEFVELAASLGLDEVHFNHLRDFRAGVFRLLDDATMGPLYRAAQEAGARRGLPVLVPMSKADEGFRCRFLQSAYLLLNGDVVPCCRMLPGASPRPSRVFGNVRQLPLEEIWTSAAYRDFRRQVHGAEPPAECRECPYASGLLN